MKEAVLFFLFFFFFTLLQQIHQMFSFSLSHVIKSPSRKLLMFAYQHAPTSTQDTCIHNFKALLLFSLFSLGTLCLARKVSLSRRRPSGEDRFPTIAGYVIFQQTRNQVSQRSTSCSITPFLYQQTQFAANFAVNLLNLTGIYIKVDSSVHCDTTSLTQGIIFSQHDKSVH